MADFKPGNNVDEVIRDLLSRVRWAGRAEPWSLTELRPSDADLDRLRDAFRTLPSSAVRSAFSGLAPSLRLGDENAGGQAVFGLFLLLLFSEVARREASEGALWATVRRSLGSNVVARDLLFDAGGQPTTATKIAMERGARHFNLRHAFDLPSDEGPGHQWYTTVFLQFGFTSQGFRRNARYWMRNLNLPKAVRLLLDHEAQFSLSQRQASSSFEELWRTLRLAARKVIARPEARRRIEASPWSPPGGAEIMLSTIESVDWSDLDTPLESQRLPEDVACDSFIGRYWWDYRQGLVSVLAELSGLATLDLSAPFYDVVIDGKRTARLLQVGEEYRLVGDPRLIADASSFVIRLPHPLRPTVSAALLDPAGNARAEQSLSLWPIETPVTLLAVADGTTRTLPLYEPMPSTGHVLAVVDGACRIEPSSLELFPLNDDRTYAALLLPDARADVRVILGTTEVWSATDPKNTLPPPSPDIVVEPVQGQSVREGDELRVIVTPKLGSRVLGLWYAKREFGSSTTDGKRTVFVIRYRTVEMPGEVELFLVLEGARGVPTVRRVRAELPTTGFFRVRDGRVQAADPTRAITRGSLVSGRYLYLPPHCDDEGEVHRNEWFVLEGNRPLARFPLRGQPRFPAAGVGAELSVRRGPLNALRDYRLTAEVVDFGELRPTHGLRPDTDGAVALQINNALLGQLDEYACVIWDRSGTCTSGQILEQSDGSAGFASVRVLPSIPCPDPQSIGLWYRGVRVGAAWTSLWSRNLRDLIARGPRNAAALLRWLHLPVLTSNASAAIREELLANHPAKLLLAWIHPYRWRTDDGDVELILPDAGLAQAGVLDSPWFSALRATTEGWLPSPSQVEPLIDELIGTIPNEELDAVPLLSALMLLTRIHPRLALGALRTYASVSLGGKGMRQLQEQFGLRLAAVSSASEVHNLIAELEEQSAQSMSALLRQPIDTGFIRGVTDRAKGLGYWTPASRDALPPNFRDTFEIELLCQFPNGRRLLTLTALGYG